MTRFEVVIFTWHYGTHKTSGARTAKGFLQAVPCVCVLSRSSSYFINNRQPNGSLSNVLSKLAVGVRVVGDGETQRKEHEREGDQEETRHRVLACVPSSTGRDRRE